ncbi:hypothetical protein Q8W71_30775 [Methylobacterium sp. NEAU 140]|uniref:hypothetical protein n=1 Tax=Methylobacterium sp. NEAU 140 TaxID=3064945 RepID=UPI002733CD47|nr:hypothetical protein [Methylobacterium sp. NEAU 140]MDP4026977.1 hypothetical protein [Methylobacterium sp. NEAU 140]
MTNVLTFTPRPRPVEPVAPEIMSAADRRARLEEVLQNTLDAADSIIAVLDHWDGDADLEPDADAEPSLAAPENAHGSQVTWMRGGDEDREAEAPEIVLPEVSRSPAPRIRSAPAPASAPLAWGGNGNVVSAAAVALFALVAGEA